MKKIMAIACAVLLCASSHASNGGHANYIYDVDYEYKTLIPTPKAEGGYDYKDEVIRGSYYLLKGPHGFLRINKTHRLDGKEQKVEGLNIWWLQPFAFRAYYDSPSKQMMLMPENPSSPPFHLEDFLEIHKNAKAYFAAMKMLEPSIEISEKDGVIEALLPKFIVAVKKDGNKTLVTISQTEVADSSYTCVVKDENGVVRVESEAKIIPQCVARPIRVEGFDFSLLKPPALDGEFIVADFRVAPSVLGPAVVYIHAGSMPDMDYSKKMAELKTAEERRVECQDFLFDNLEEAPTTFEGLPKIMEYLNGHSSNPKK